MNVYLESVTRTWCHLYTVLVHFFATHAICQTLVARNMDMKNMALALKELRN